MPIFCILAIFVFGIPLLKEQIENQNYREECRRRGEKTYWSVDGLRYTDTDKKVYKQEDLIRGALLGIIVFGLSLQKIIGEACIKTAVKGTADRQVTTYMKYHHKGY